MTPPQIVYQASGTPYIEGAEAVRVTCWLCGGEDEAGVSLAAWSSETITAREAARPDQTHICRGCAYVTARTSPVPGRPPKPGKKWGGNFRNYSHWWSEGTGYRNASKGEKPEALAFLLAVKSGPWFLSIAESGQKHVLCYAQMTRGRGRVLFEEERIWVPASALDDCATVTGLLTDGATKDEVSTGDYSARTWGRIPDLAERDAPLRSIRGGAWFRLVVFLCQRQEVSDGQGDKGSGDRDPDGVQGGIRRQRRKRPRPLQQDDVATAVGREDDRDRRRVVDEVAQGDGRNLTQRKLFGSDNETG